MKGEQKCVTKTFPLSLIVKGSCHPCQAIAPLYAGLQERKLFYPWEEREMLSSSKEVKFCRNSGLLIDCSDRVQFDFE